jgi:hypothetical protein
MIKNGWHNTHRAMARISYLASGCQAMPSLKNASDQAEPVDTENTLLRWCMVIIANTIDRTKII